nr:importin subunit alpha-2-like [Tanacetum cinerariifolium]GFA93728.1 importin subunit alpha-2-like [Tanacetum cinerariifolium]
MSLGTSTRTKVHKNRYKVAVDVDEGRRCREDNIVKIRNNKKGENLLKKRRAFSNSQSLNGGGVSAQPSTVKKKIGFIPVELI